ncbi:hypothetical protein [Streptomyces sp. NPDC059894]|uniref:hypothetical protein n=1 Tax=unclassified Streptomyces TaxID=2593676 RepID=UPI00364FA1C5
MRTTAILRALAAVLLTGGALAATAAGTTAAAAPQATAEARAAGVGCLVLGHDWSATLADAFSYSSSWTIGVCEASVDTSGTSSGEWEWTPLAR